MRVRTLSRRCDRFVGAKISSWRQRSTITVLVGLLLAGNVEPLAAGEPKRLTELSSRQEPTAPRDLIAVQDRLFFTVGRSELWVSDGTADGTTLVRALPDAGRWEPENDLSDDYTVVGHRLFSWAFHPEYGSELWVSDGTPEGTALIKDIVPGPSGSNPLDLTVVGDLVFFTVTHPDDGEMLWVTNGTPEGTLGLQTLVGPLSVRAAGERCFFTTQHPEHGPSLWVSDGTTDGTVPLASGATTGESSFWLAQPVGERAFFVGRHPENGTMLWTSDGTIEGTTPLKEIGNAEKFTATDERLFFTEHTANQGEWLWISDGTAAGTTRLKIIVHAVDHNPFDYQSSLLTAVGERLFFTVARRGYTQREVWVSDGTTDGTQVVTDRPPGDEVENDDDERFQLTAVGKRLFFTAGGLWVSDGTEGGTEQLTEGPDKPRELTALGEGLVFTATAPRKANELWFSDGSADGTTPFPAVPGDPRRLTLVGDRLFLVASFQLSDSPAPGARLDDAELWTLPLESRPFFVRGELNADGSLDASDAISILNFLFLGADAPGCADAADTNDDGILNIVDPVYSLRTLFLGGADPSARFGRCGTDATPDSIDCAEPPGC